MRLWIPILIIAFFAVSQLSFASYSVINVSTQINLRQNTSASVREIVTIGLTNSSINSYTTDRSALNLTLSNWQSIIGPTLTQHIINPKSGVHRFELLPGPVTTTVTGGHIAQIIMLYDVYNVTYLVETSPRIFFYTFNDSVFNFQHELAGEVLPPNTKLTINLPAGARITSIFPIPDSPTNLITSNYTNSTSLSWFNQEPLSKFALSFTIRQSLQAEVLQFFSGVYNSLGVLTYIIIGLVVLIFIIYTYLKVDK